MESDEGDIVDIFEDENEGQADGAENQESTNDASTGAKVPVPTKRIIKNPRLKFNADRLCGERGIPVLVDHFKNVKFKGKGHEKEDLDKLLSHLEHWTHRLFPSMKFEDCLNQIEKLGKKRPVQTCLRKIRLDMPILTNDFIGNDDDDDDHVMRNDDPEPPSNEDAFDKLIQESQDLLNSNTSDNFDYSSATYSSPLSTPAAGQVLGSSFGSSLTAEQKERMERNKMLAAERRKARLSALQTNTSILAQGNDKIDGCQASVTHDNFLNQPNSSVKENNFDAITKSISIENINNENNTSILCDQTSEKLGLDDLVNFIDEEPEPSKKLVFDDSNSSDNFTKEAHSQNKILDDDLSSTKCIEIGCGVSDITEKFDDTISGINIDRNNDLECSKNMDKVHSLNNTTVNNAVKVLNDTSCIIESIEDGIPDINSKTKDNYVDIDETLYKEDCTLNTASNGPTKVINNESGIIENMDDNVSDEVEDGEGDIFEKHSENHKCLKYNVDVENEMLIQKEMSGIECVDVVKNMDAGVSGAVAINLGNIGDALEKEIETNDDCLGLDELMDLVDE